MEETMIAMSELHLHETMEDETMEDETMEGPAVEVLPPVVLAMSELHDTMEGPAVDVLHLDKTMVRSDSYLRLLAYLDMPSVAAMERTTTSMRPGMRQATERFNAMEGSMEVVEGADTVVAWSRRMQWVRLAVQQRAAARGKGAVACGLRHSLVKSEAGSVWSFGTTLPAGWLGHGSESKEVVPRLIAHLEKVQVVAVTTGDSSSMALSAEGHVFTWGNGWFGQQGQGDNNNRLVPTKVESLAGVSRIAAGSDHSLAVAGVKVYSWGLGHYGQLGLGDNNSRNVPTVVPGLGGAQGLAVAVEAEGHHSFALDRDGTLWSWGVNCNGQLGLGDTQSRSSPTVVAGLRRVVDMAGGYAHTIAATLEGHVYAWGHNKATGHEFDCYEPTRVTSYSTPGVTAGLEGVVQVAAGRFHSMAVTQTGQLLTWGSGAKGQLGHGRKEHEKVPRVVGGAGVVLGAAGGSYHSMAVRESGEVVVFGEGAAGDAADADGRLGLGAQVMEALQPTVVKSQS